MADVSALSSLTSARACDSQVLDLRKFKQAVEVVPFDGDVTCLDWDHSGKYLVRARALRPPSCRPPSVVTVRAARARTEASAAADRSW